MASCSLQEWTESREVSCHQGKQATQSNKREGKQLGAGEEGQSNEWRTDKPTMKADLEGLAFMGSKPWDRSITKTSGQPLFPAYFSSF